jgi:hypothetical protein
MSKNDGGPAFPLADSNAEYAGTSRHDCNGMSLRDYLAAKAMQGILSDQTTISAFDQAGKRELVQPSSLVATAAYAMADAMLKAREQ